MLISNHTLLPSVCLLRVLTLSIYTYIIPYSQKYINTTHTHTHTHTYTHTQGPWLTHLSAHPSPVQASHSRGGPECGSPGPGHA
ncbi:hypothetical protein EON63_25135 [archaeon]|nr:MAG: hypothetical protein EON63_25135 [archaeon]